MDPLLRSTLDFVVSNSEANKSPQNPFGYCYAPATAEAQLRALEQNKLIECGWANRNPTDGSIPVRPTQAGVTADGEVSSVDTAPEPASTLAALASHVVVEDNVPIPAAARFGRVRSGEPLVAKFPFATLQVGQSFFIPGTPGSDKPVHRSFASVVSQANKKYYPKNFQIRPDKSGGIEGARIWRTEDLDGPRPVRARKGKEAAPAPQAGMVAGAAPAPGPASFPASGAPGFAAPGAAFGASVAPAGFPPVAAPFPGAAPAGGGWANAPQFDEALPQPE